MQRYLAVVDTPSVKQFVFGTDTLAEIRGASALLDRLNREDLPALLGQREGLDVTIVYANGGAGQFVITANSAIDVRTAFDDVSRRFLAETGGEVRLLSGIAEWPENTSYPESLRRAFAELHLRRDSSLGRATTATMPLVLECESSSHLPAVGIVPWGGERRLLSAACQAKLEMSRKARGGQLWNGWMEYLEARGPWPHDLDRLRCINAEQIGQMSERRRNYVGLVYADGNAMGQLVQKLDNPEIFRAFSDLVDDSIREACYQALTDACQDAIAKARTWACGASDGASLLPADILLLGGDDLLVLVPADRALSFAIDVSRTFEQLTREKINSLDAHTRKFFEHHLRGRGLTISCGVAIGPARFPFYLMLDMAEALLASAKRAGYQDHGGSGYVDFHSVTASSGQDVEMVRRQEYQIESTHPRTLRPYSVDGLATLRDAVNRLRAAELPRSKLHDLFEAGLQPHPVQVERAAKEIFSRLRSGNANQSDQRLALWQALSQFGRLAPFPWVNHESSRGTPLVDLVEAFDLF